MAEWVSTPCNGRIFYVEAHHAAAIRRQTVMLLTDKEGVFKIKLLLPAFRRLDSQPKGRGYTLYSNVYKSKSYYILLRVGHSIALPGICFER